MAFLSYLFLRRGMDTAVFKEVERTLTALFNSSDRTLVYAARRERNEVIMYAGRQPCRWMREKGQSVAVHPLARFQTGRGAVFDAAWGFARARYYAVSEEDGPVACEAAEPTTNERQTDLTPPYGCAISRELARH